MKLFRVSVKHKHDWRKFDPLYVVGESKKSALEYATRHLRGNLEIVKVVYLGDDLTLGHMMFRKAQKEKKV